jgi:hypothetical protein
MTTCKCGRAYDHCKVCGLTNLYVKKNKSTGASLAANRPITVFGCRSKGHEFTSDDECKAPRDTAVNYVFTRKQDMPDKRPQSTLDPDSWDYYLVYAERKLRLASTMKYHDEDELNEAMVKEGWVIIPDDTEYVDGKRVYAIEPTQGQTITNSVPPTEVNVEPEDFTLDDVIERMKKEQGG